MDVPAFLVAVAVEPRLLSPLEMLLANLRARLNATFTLVAATACSTLLHRHIQGGAANLEISRSFPLTFAGNATFTAFWTAIRTIELPLVTSEGLQRGAESHNSRVHVALNAERKLEQARKNKPPPQNIKKGLWP